MVTEWVKLQNIQSAKEDIVMKFIRARANIRIDCAIHRISDWISAGGGCGSHLDRDAKISGSSRAPRTYPSKSISKIENTFGLRQQ